MYVVYADADDDARGRVCDALADASASVTAVDSAGSALVALADDPADCLVCEHALPDADAPTLLGRVRELDPDLPVVVHTDDGSEALAGELLAAGADGYVPKAADASVLVDRVRAVAGDGTTRVTDRAGDPVPGATAERLSLLVEQAPLAIVEWDRELRVVGWNQAATELFGYDREDAVGRSGLDLLVPEPAREEAAAARERVLAGEGGDFDVVEALRADGTTVTCEWHDAPMTDGAGDVVGVLSFVRDVGTEVRRAEQLEALQETSRALMGAGSREAVAEEILAAVERVLDQPVASVRLYEEGRNVLETVSMTDRADELVSATAGEPPPIGPEEGHAWSVFESGERRVLSASAGVVYDGNLGVESLLFEPLGDHGVLVLGATEPDGLSGIDANMVSVLGTTATAAMDSAARARELESAEAILEAAGDAVFALGDDGRFVQVNDRQVELSGYDREEHVGADPSLLLDDTDVERGREYVRRLIDGEADVVTYEVTVTTKEGERIPCEVSQSLLPGETFEGTVGTARPIAQRKEMERTLRERKRKIEGLHDVATRLEACETPADVCEVTAAAAERILNFEACVLGLVEGEEFVVEAATGERTDRFDGRTTVEGTLGGRAYDAGETRVVDDVTAADGVDAIHPDFRAVLSVPLGEHGILQAISDEVGAYDGEDAELAELLAAHATDALDRVAYEAELRSERDRLAALFDNVPDPVVSGRHTDEGPVVHSVNPAFERVFGYDAEALAGEPIDEYIVPPGERDEAARLNRAAADGEVVEREVVRRTADGLREFELTVVPVDFDGEASATFGVYADVTEQKQRRERVEVLNRILRHDLRNGMNIVRGAAELLGDAVDGEATIHADTILDRADELVSLAERTRAVERTLDRGEEPSGPMDLSAFLASVASELRAEYPAAAVSLSTAEEAVVEGGYLLEVALRDVVENAIEHNDRAEPRVVVDVDRGPDEGAVRVRVADDGPGIPDSERRLLAGEQEITQLRHGSGLGLWLVNWAVTYAGGELSIRDNEPRGTVVVVKLPRADADERTPPIESG